VISEVAEIKNTGGQPAAVLPLRRVVEQTLASILLGVMAVPIALTALAVWLCLGRPILFRQLRAGLNAQHFTISKFRTMRDSRDADGTLLPDHLRETKVTRLMRRIRVDEFPQLLAIASGEMSFLGPRPLLPATIEGMGELGRVRCRILPGLSGWAQVNGNTRLNDQQKLALDVWYVDHKTLRLDMIILLKTLVTLLRGERIDMRRLKEAEDYVQRQYRTGMQQ